MKEVSFESMIKNNSSDYILIGKGLEKLKNKLLKDSFPMPYERIKKYYRKSWMISNSLNSGVI